VPVIERSVSAPRIAKSLSGVVKRDQRATFAIIVDNEPGVLHRVVGLFAARGYYIESLAVAETADGTHTSRITIVTSGAPEVLEQIHAQLKKLIAAREVHDVTGNPIGLERELAVVKVRGSGAGRTEALQVSEIFGAKVIDITADGFVFEVTGSPMKVDRFIDLMRPLGLVELSRSGVLSVSRWVDESRENGTLEAYRRCT